MITVPGLVPLLEVLDMPASIRFYRDAPGLDAIRTSTPRNDCGSAVLGLIP